MILEGGMQMRCLIEKIFYTNSNGISEFQAINMDNQVRVHMRGFLLSPKIGAKLCFEDTVEDRDGCLTYRRSYSVIETADEAVRVLCGANGISKKTAAKIVETCGNNVPEYLNSQGFRSRLAKIPGFGPAKTAALIAFLQSQIDHSDEFAWLTAIGLSYTVSMALLKEHGKSVKEWVQQNPYQLLYTKRVDFRLCDRIARINGEDTWSAHRIQALIYATALKEERNGNTRCPMDTLTRQCEKLSVCNGGQAVPTELISLYAYNNPGFRITADSDEIYIASLKNDKAEESICADINRLKNAAKPLERLSQEEYEQIERETSIQYNSEQQEAFDMLAGGGVIAITGFPGTGKTTLLNGLLRYISIKNSKATVLLCAPTGRAASRMAEVSGHAGITMHRAVHITPYDTAVRSAEPLDYQFIIADEMSMCDTELCARFFSAVKSGTTVILTGDPDQLPSVGAGQVFRDIVASGAIPVCRLTKLMRQKENSVIAANARGALEGAELQEGSDFKIRCMDDEEMADAVVRACEGQKTLPLVLSPVIKGNAGIAAINRKMQEKYRKSAVVASINGTRFYVGDPVIMTHNNYTLQYFNGETGTIAEILNGRLVISFKDRMLSMELADATDMALAYAITVHRAQGTENEHCIVILPSYAYRMATGELLNTAFTRAKKAVLLLTSDLAKNYHVQHGRGAMRCCGLRQKLRSKFYV